MVLQKVLDQKLSPHRNENSPVGTRVALGFVAGSKRPLCSVVDVLMHPVSLHVVRNGAPQGWLDPLGSICPLTGVERSPPKTGRTGLEPEDVAITRDGGARTGGAEATDHPPSPTWGQAPCPGTPHPDVPRSGFPCSEGPDAPVAGLPRSPMGYEVVAALNGPHLRAARALLGWAMADLAEVSGLSLSTVRRLEQNVHSVGLRNRCAAVDALEGGGIRFLRLDDGTIALAEPTAQPSTARV